LTGKCETGYEIILWTGIILTIALVFWYLRQVRGLIENKKEKELKKHFRLFSLVVYTLLNTVILIMLVGTKLACHGDGQTLLMCLMSGPISSIGLIILGFIVDLKKETYSFYMNVQEQIQEYITSQPEPKRSDMQKLHRIIQKIMPACKLWFLDGKNGEDKTVSNPNIGYGLYTIKYADGKTREFYQIGMSANKTGISIYILGLNDKTYLAKTYGEKIGKASVSGYCIKFKTLKDINIEILEAAIRYGAEAQQQ
jgi:hypothetical protein